MKLQKILVAVIFCILGTHLAANAQQVREFQLDNGMRLIVKEDHRAPVVVHMVWYKAGSIDEVSGKTGLAHALEHMMFKGTEKYKQGEFNKIVAALGGRDNAFTSMDYTAYYQQIGKESLERMMDLESDRMANLVLTKEEFDKEMKVIREERRWRTDDQPSSLLREAVYATSFMAHPYHWPVIGWMSDLENMVVDDAIQWHEKWYAPNNATLVVVGDVVPEEVYALAQKYYGAIPARDITRRPPQDEPPQRGIRRVTVKAPAENPIVLLAFKVPSLRDVEKDNDSYALDVLAAILDGYDNARLNARLVRQDRIASSVSAGYSTPSRGPALFTLSAVPLGKTTTAELEKRLREEVAKIAREGVTREELNRVKMQLVSSQIYKRDSLFEQAIEIGTLETTGIGYQQMDRIIEKLKTVTPEQVQAAAQRYFDEDMLTVGTLVPLPLEQDGKRPQAAAKQ